MSIHQMKMSIGRTLSVLQLNIEGSSSEKSEFLSRMANENRVDVIAVQETHILNPADYDSRGHVNGFTVAAYLAHASYGLATYVRDDHTNYDVIFLNVIPPYDSSLSVDEDDLEVPAKKPNLKTIYEWEMYREFSNAQEAETSLDAKAWNRCRRTETEAGLKIYFRCNKVKLRGPQCAAALYRLFLTHRISPRIPKDFATRNDWLNLLDLSTTTTSRVCSKHFHPSDFVVKGNGHKWLKKDAYPLQVMKTPEQFENEVEVENVPLQYKLNKVGIVTHKYRGLAMGLRRSLQRVRKQMIKMNKEHKQTMQKFSNFSNLSSLLQELFMLLMKHHKCNSSPKEYSPEIRKFALSLHYLFINKNKILHYYSPAGYKFLRSTFNNCLPHTQTIAAWYRVIDGQPGFTVESLDALTELQRQTPYPIVVSLVLDGMAIRKHVQRMGYKIVGYTNTGVVLTEVDEEHKLAKEALIYLVVGVNVPFTVQIGYFLINSLTGKQIAYITEIGITLVLNYEEFENSIENALSLKGFRPNFEAYYNIISYISGYIARRLHSMIKCSVCSNALIHFLNEEELAHLDDNEDHGYDDVTDNMDMNYPVEDEDYHMKTFGHANDANSQSGVNTTMDGVFFIDADDTRHECDSEDEVDPLVDEENIDERPDVDEDEGIRVDFDLCQVEDLAKKYYNLIKQKDRGGLFYPSDSLYRISIFADLVFTAALKDSGKRMLKRNFTLGRLVESAQILCDKYSSVLFCNLKDHFDMASDHEDFLIQSILKFYLRIRIDFLNKGVSANSGKRQKLVHSLHFDGV
ncbi:DNA transposase THAP9 [Pseudolycoriella hygida]|uniref:DNA transposase THAP9 n=1 Tax=Pseudolycoriella hygida TaxID=35572 RepID=A0A9Q0MWW4_9DIPT|nr:DNA transposase THAP9 [Pseudolycoriella hygida]